MNSSTAIPHSETIPWWEPRIERDDAELIQSVLDSNFPNDGEITTEFENFLSEILSIRYVVCVTSGTAALFLALKALNIGYGDEVIIPDITFVATANAVSMAGATPVIVDVEPNSLNICPKSISENITPKTRAIIPVHVSGRGANMTLIRQIADEYNVAIIEDAAEALASQKDGKFLGAHGEMGCFSFSPNKTISCGQGGAVVTDNPDLHQRLRELKDQGRVKRGTGGADLHPTVGFNFKLTNLQSALGLGQMKYLQERICILRRHYTQYASRLADKPGIRVLEFDLDGGETPQWIDVLVDDREGLVCHLDRHHIDSRIFWHPVHRHSPYLRPDKYFPVSTEISRRALWLPSAFTLSVAKIDRVCNVILDFLD